MRVANYNGRATIVTTDGVIDVEAASRGIFSADLMLAVEVVDDIADWFATAHPAVDATLSLENLAHNPKLLGPPVPYPSQVFAVGLNYMDHSVETGLAAPDSPLIFTKFPSSIAGPGSVIPLPTETVDWEVELVAVIGPGGRNIAASHALDHIAGLCVGQDISERTLQMAGATPQFGLAKSYEGFAPIGPWLTTLDEIDDLSSLHLSCAIDGEVVQEGRTDDMIFDLPTLVENLSAVCELRPGDLIFTGTPAGVGYSRTPARYLAPGTILRSSITGLGELTNECR